MVSGWPGGRTVSTMLVRCWRGVDQRVLANAPPPPTDIALPVGLQWLQERAYISAIVFHHYGKIIITSIHVQEWNPPFLPRGWDYEVAGNNWRVLDQIGAWPYTPSGAGGVVIKCYYYLTELFQKETKTKSPSTVCWQVELLSKSLAIIFRRRFET